MCDCKRLLPGSGAEETNARLSQSTSRLFNCLERARNWEPKLKARTEALSAYRESLQRLEKWLVSADAVLAGGGRYKEEALKHEVKNLNLWRKSENTLFFLHIF